MEQSLIPLTHPHSPHIEEYRARTPAGMEHWSGTGPEGTRRISCLKAKFNGYYAVGRRGGALKPIQCHVYMKTMLDAPKFDAMKDSCRFYEPGGEAPKRGK